MKPPFTYYGAKIRRAPRIVELLPQHSNYVEPFAGSLAVLLAKPPSRVETVNDLNGNLVTFWRVLRDRPADLARACELTPYARDELDLASASMDTWCTLDEVERARRIWVMLVQGFGNLLKPTTWQPHRAGGANRTTATASTLAGRLLPAAGRLHNVAIENRDALEVIEKFGAFEGACIYADPPYLGTTRRSATADYPHEMVGEGAHRALAAALNSCRASAVLSGYHSPLYDYLYSGWDVVEMDAYASRGEDRKRVEVLWIKRAGDTTGRKPDGLF